MNERVMGDDYRVNLEVFEGPLDLLLYLIKKNDLDIYDIPIAFVLEKYMTYLDGLKELNIDLAGDFLLMAAELVQIKSRMLLPQEAPEEEDEGIDPRADLVHRLLDYQRYKGASEDLASRAMLSRDVFVPLTPERVIAASDGRLEGNVYDLVEMFSRILKRIPVESFHEVAVDRVSINDRIYQILGQVKKGVTTSIEQLLADPITRYDVVITFLALLEMCRLRMIRVYQPEACGSILIQGIMEEVREEDMLHLVEGEGKIEEGRGT